MLGTFGFMVCVIVATVAGCRTSQPVTPPGSSIDRLMERYPEMRAGHFAIIADFEDDKQLELFHVDSASGSAAIEHVTANRQRRAEPNRPDGKSLRFQSGLPDDVLVVNNDHAQNWYLKRDWRDYDVLRLAVEAPQDDLLLRLSIRAGARGSSRVVEAVTPVKRGHAEVRFDLAELGGHLPLDEVRELRLSLDNISRVTSIRLYDILLTRDRETIVGDPAGGDGGLFVRRIGRRYHIGASGQFELIFGHGQIVGWYDLIHDPHRLHNLVADTSLGPMIDVGAPRETGSAKMLFADARDCNAEAQAFVADGATEVRTELIEASAVRAVLAGEWYFNRADHKYQSNPVPDRRWLYTVYPTGDVYVQVQATIPEVEAKGDEEVPFVLRVSTAVSGEHGDSYPIVRDNAGVHGADFAMIRASQSSTLMWAPYAHGGMRIEPTPGKGVDSGAAQVTVRAQGVSNRLKPAAQDAGTICTASLMSLRSSGSGNEDKRRPVAETAAFYLSPPAVDTQVGICRELENVCALPSGCFQRGNGSYHVIAEGDVVRFLMDESVLTALAPALVIHGSEGRDSWVYVNQRLHEPTERDEADRLIFQLRGPAPESVLVEVLLKPR